MIKFMLGQDGTLTWRSQTEDGGIGWASLFILLHVR